MGRTTYDRSMVDMVEMGTLTYEIRRAAERVRDTDRRTAAHRYELGRLKALIARYRAAMGEGAQSLTPDTGYPAL